MEDINITIDNFELTKRMKGVHHEVIKALLKEKINFHFFESFDIHLNNDRINIMHKKN